MAQMVDRSGVEWYADGLHEFNNNLFSDAAATFREFRSAYPDHPRAPDAMYHEAESYLALGREDDAIRLLSAFERRYPRHPYAFGSRLSLGKYFFETGDYDRAILTLEQVMERTPTPQQAALALYWMGESAHRLRREDEAISYFEEVVRDYPQTETAPRAAYAIAYNQVELGRYDAAAASFERLDRQFAGSSWANNMGLALAEVYYEISEYGRAAAEIERRLPNMQGEARDRAIFLLAESYNQTRNSDGAIVNYRHFTEGDTISPYFERALYGLAWNYHHEGAWQWAADNFSMVRDSGHESLAGESAYYVGTNLRLAEDAAGSISAYQQFLSNFKGHRLADHGWYELGIVFYEERQWQSARDAFRQLVDGYPSSELRGDGLKHLGNTQIALGNFEAAHEAFDQAIDEGTVSVELLEEIIFQKAWLNYRNREYNASAVEFMELFSSNPSSAGASETLFWAAESNFQIGQFAIAEQLFTRYLRDYPGARHADAAQYALGWTYFKQGNYGAAIPRFEAFLDAYRDETGTVPYRSDARLRLADSYFALKRYPEAVRVYGRMAANGDDYSMYQIGQAYSNSGDAFEASSTFRQLLEAFPLSEWREEAQYSLGYLFFLNQEYEQAIVEYQHLIDSYPLDPLAAKAQYGKGDARFNGGDINAAVKEYERVLTNYPTSPFVADAAAGIQFALLATGQEDRADSVVDSLALVLQGTPAAEQLRFRQAEAKYQAGLIDPSMADFMRFLEFAQDEDLRSETHFYLAQAFEQKNESTFAQQHYRTIVDDHPTSARSTDAAGNLGHLVLGSGNADEAERLFRLMEERSNGEARTISLARYGLSLALSAQGRDLEAESLLQEAVEVAPMSEASWPAYLGLARIAEQRQELSEAERLYDVVTSRSRDETGAEALFLLGELQLESGRVNQGIETHSRMQALFAGYPQWLARSTFSQGQAFESLGDRGQAIRLYQMIQSMYPESDVAVLAAARLEDLQ